MNTAVRGQAEQTYSIWFFTHGNVSDEGLAGAAIGVAAPTKAIISLREKEFCDPLWTVAVRFNCDHFGIRVRV